MYLPDAAARPAPGARGVLVTRPATEAAATAGRLAELGFAPVIAPMLRIAARRAVLPAGIQAILVASGNALPGLPACGVPLLAVGDATAAKARTQGFTQVLSAGRDAVALAALAAERLRPESGPVLVASGAGQGAALCAALRQAGFRVLRRVTYASLPAGRFPPPAAAALRAGTLHGALFMSGQTAAAFVRLVPPDLHFALQNVRAVAIGNSAADALSALPWREVRLARTPTLDDVLAQL